jgi:hypothetical protein
MKMTENVYSALTYVLTVILLKDVENASLMLDLILMTVPVLRGITYQIVPVSSALMICVESAQRIPVVLAL